MSKSPKNNCPLKGRCKDKNLIYQAEVLNIQDGTREYYIGATSTTFKERLGVHKQSFRNRNQCQTTLGSVANYPAWDIRIPRPEGVKVYGSGPDHRQGTGRGRGRVAQQERAPTSECNPGTSHQVSTARQGAIPQVHPTNPNPLKPGTRCKCTQTVIAPIMKDRETQTLISVSPSIMFLPTPESMTYLLL